MELKEIAKEILQKKFRGETRPMAEALKIGEMDLRRLAGIDPGSRRNQEKIFQITLRILPLCKEVGIDPQPQPDPTPAQKLSKSPTGGLLNETMDKTAGGANAGAKTKGKK